MHIPQWDIAAGQAEELVRDNMRKVSRGTPSPKKLIQDALIPVFGIRWDASAGRRVKSTRICNIIWHIRNSKLDSLTYRGISLLRNTFIEEETDPPSAWADWGAAIERFNLDGEFNLSEWAEVIETSTKLGWSSPSKLALVSSTQLRTSIEGHAKGTAALQLRTASALLFADVSSDAFLVLKGASGNAGKIIRRLKNAHLCSNAARPDVKTALNKSKISKHPEDFDKLGPTEKLKTIRKAQHPQYMMNRLFRTSSQSIAINGIRRFFPSFASGIRCYYSFCELRGTPPCPERERVVTEWISISKPGLTF